ncbi:MAG TPA: hypothetical protein VHI13_08505 [Candidatus Kapabacteria bacterium]|nr:hypothetical protein [Candidatus Kapabacteria bacterium]
MITPSEEIAGNGTPRPDPASTLGELTALRASMALAMKTLMEVGYSDFFNTPSRLKKSEDTLYLMYLAVRSPIAADLWNHDGSVRCIS